MVVIDEGDDVDGEQGGDDEEQGDDDEEKDDDANLMMIVMTHLRSCSASPNPGMLMSPVIASTRLSRSHPQVRILKSYIR